MQKAAEIVIHDFRSGDLGRVTLEMPEEFALWMAAGLVAQAERNSKIKSKAKVQAAPTA